MTTRTIMKAEIIDDMVRNATTDGARVLSAISSAIKFYQPKRFFFNESRTVTFNTVAAQDTYTFGTAGDITTEFYTIDGVFLTESGGNIIELPLVDYTGFETLTTTSAQPYMCAYIGRSLRFHPVPDAVYAIGITGHIKAAEPASDDEASNVWFTEAYELIRCRSKAYLYAHVFPDQGIAQIMAVAEKEARGALRSATTSKTATGTLAPAMF